MIDESQWFYRQLLKSKRTQRSLITEVYLFVSLAIFIKTTSSSSHSSPPPGIKDYCSNRETEEQRTTWTTTLTAALLDQNRSHDESVVEMINYWVRNTHRKANIVNNATFNKACQNYLNMIISHEGQQLVYHKVSWSDVAMQWIILLWLANTTFPEKALRMKNIYI